MNIEIPKNESHTEGEGVTDGILNDNVVVETIHRAEKEIIELDSKIDVIEDEISKIRNSDYQGDENKKNMDLEDAQKIRDGLFKKMGATHENLTKFEDLKKESSTELISNDN